MDDEIAQFTSITGATPDRAAQYLRVTENNLEQALQLFFESDGVDMGGGDAPAPQAVSQQGPILGNDRDVIQIDSDDDESSLPATARGAPPTGRRIPADDVEDDETMARRLQQEMYGGGNEASGDAMRAQIRAPQARTSETLLESWGGDWRENPDSMSAAIAEQLLSRRGNAGRPGIFNQRPMTPSIWDEDNNNNDDDESRRRNLSRATAGASDASSKYNMLAEMYRPPSELISPLSWDGLRDEGKDKEKWILVDIQDPAVFDCQVLNRDLWKHAEIKETVKENFLFKQYEKHDPAAQNYIQYYFQAHESQDAYPHIAIVDPRTGEQVKVWSGAPPPKPLDFLMQLHEFLDRYSLKAYVKNPVAKRKPERRKEMDVDKLTEEEALELALQASLGAAQGGLKPVDPDDLTRSIELGKGKARAQPVDASLGESSTSNGAAQNGRNSTPAPPSIFQSILANPHTEPPADPTTTTRIQFRHSGGRIVRRFLLADPVRRLYEWLKAEPLQGKEGLEFDLFLVGRNLADILDSTIEAAGLKNGSVMVEFLEG